ncbi:MAG: hypothetical protein WC322_04170 [Candidatus Paceibacterota bacterium]|jgi:hypothetical protein
MKGKVMLAPDELPMAYEFEHEDDRDALCPHIDGVIPTPMTLEERGWALGMLMGNLRRIYAAYDEDGEDLSALPAKAADEIDRLIDQVAKNADAEEMADVGRALMKAIEVHAYPSWGPAECPSEIVGDLRNECDELSAELKKTEAIRAELERQKAYAYGLVDRIHELQGLVYQYKNDADRYRRLRDEDAWGEDTADGGCSAWQRLGELSGKGFDEFVDARFMQRATAGDC